MNLLRMAKHHPSHEPSMCFEAAGAGGAQVSAGLPRVRQAQPRRWLRRESAFEEKIWRARPAPRDS